ncbi:2OG-Fe(II) oxygenase [Microbulbifer taiwanensis]|uniref:2OG-Fe(II) oxygenase n=1 Tax=Microbulbifer taiwanensis TaxID=986746 RepID=A0ABW1YNX2_9GAMM|nr:2OG-Fe(II) oxygenase [Microbulbifer taiwanensis]
MNTTVSALAEVRPAYLRRPGARDGDPLDQVATALRSDGYIVLPAPLPPAVLGGMLRHFRSIDRERFKRAGIGREEEHQLNRFVRGDEIFWLDSANPAVAAYLSWMEALRLGLNRRLFLGLFDYECHYAYYDRGTFYRKHLDAFKGNTNRVLSTVLYLTPNWQPRDGGELAIYPPEVDGAPPAEPLLKVAPRFGQMVIFLSEEFPHEVLMVNRPRYSVTGWFRVNNSLGDSIDPAK